MLSFSYSISVSPHLNYTSKNRYYLTFIDKENEDSEGIPTCNYTIKHMFPISMTSSSSIQLNKPETSFYLLLYFLYLISHKVLPTTQMLLKIIYIFSFPVTAKLKFSSSFFLRKQKSNNPLVGFPMSVSPIQICKPS